MVSDKQILKSIPLVLKTITISKLGKKYSGKVRDYYIVGDKRISMYELAVLAGSKNIGKITLDGYKGPPLTVDMSLSTVRWEKYRIQ